MKKNIFIISKAPFQGLIKNRLSKEIGYRKSKRLVNNTIEKVNKIFLHKKKEYKISLKDIYIKKKNIAFHGTYYLAKNLEHIPLL